jgi:hypothetical protein
LPAFQSTHYTGNMASEEEVPEAVTADDNEAPTIPCPPPTDAGGDPSARYSLEGPQVEYEAAFWLVEGKLCMPTIDQIVKKLGAKLIPYSTDPTVLGKEIDQLKELGKARRTAFPKLNLQTINLAGISDFIYLQKQPFGAVFNTNLEQYQVNDVVSQQNRIKLSQQVIQNGGELARMFENETPGLYHRHALNWLLYNRADFSPVRHARIWAALDLTIYAALAAAWHFKWAYGKGVSFRQRPWEYDHSLTVLFDSKVNKLGDGNGAGKEDPCPTPGTPRHPAYPSGHSTYSAAASHLLKHFFRGNSDSPNSARANINVPTELDKLADNIGQARLWAGVHWESDHTFGRDVGIAVAEVIIDQLERDCVPGLSNSTPPTSPPSPNDLADARDTRTKPCVNGATHDTIPPRKDTTQEKNAF